MEEADNIVEQKPDDLSGVWTIVLGLAALAGLIFYYGPLLSCSADVYCSDLTFYFEPFSKFIGENARKGILALWNPMLYAGMSQIATPSPGMFYPPSWFMFLLPFSCGLAWYMLFHQTLMGAGAYLLLRDLRFSRASSIFASSVLALCAYNFSFLRNFTLPGSMAWFPIALYFTRKIDARRAWHSFGWMLGLAFCTSMLVYVGRPEVGVPELLLIGTGCVWSPLNHLYRRWKEKNSTIEDSKLPDDGDASSRPAEASTLEKNKKESAKDKSAQKNFAEENSTQKTDALESATQRTNASEFSKQRTDAQNASQGTNASNDSKESGSDELIFSAILKLACMILGIAWAMPTIFPGVEWTALSPRSQGMALKWVFTWSANWFDFLCIIFSNPFGDLCRLTDQAAHIRQMVLSRGSHLPFLSSAYLSPLVVTLSYIGLFDRKNTLKRLAILIFIGFSLMAAGNYTPIAPSIVKLSHALASLRYPVKLLIFPCLSLILLASLGIEMVLRKRVPEFALKSISIFWIVLLALGLPLGYIPQIGFAATKLSFLFHKTPDLSLVKTTQYMLADSIQLAAVLGITCCALIFAALKDKLKPTASVACITVITILALVQSSWVFSNYTKYGFYEHKSSVAKSINTLRDTTSGAPLSRENGTSASRVLNLFFDPVSVPKTYEYYRGCEFDESFFQYCREVMLYQTIMDARFSSSYGYEAAETADYKNCYTDVYLTSSQHQRKDGEIRALSDKPLHRFCSLTATEFANSQIYKLSPSYDIPILDSSLFELAIVNSTMNYRVYRVIDPRPRVYLTDNLCFVESFKDLEKVICTSKDVPQAQILDNSPDITYVLNRDRNKNKIFFESLTQSSAMTGSSSVNKDSSAQITFDNGQAITVQVASTTPKVLVIADHFYPGWVVNLDGKEVESIKVNLLNRGVLIPAGTHSVSLRYSPKTLSDAVKIAIAATLSFTLLFFVLIKLLQRRSLLQK